MTGARRWVWLLAVGCGCTADPEVGEIAGALTPVTWTDVVGASAVGNDLTKTAPETLWNAGAVSVEALSGDGYVEFTTGEATTAKMAGLSNGNGGQDHADIDFAIRLTATGRVEINEGGVLVGTFGAYGAGDLFRVQAEGDEVTYWRNGAHLYTSAGTPSFPLLVDTSLRTPGATISDVGIQSTVFWTDLVGASASGNDLTKTAPEVLWNAGAASIATIAAGDGYVEFTAADDTTAKAAGLSNGNSGQGRADIDFAFYLSEVGSVAIYEAGIKIGNFEQYRAGDHFQVEIAGGVVRYYRNRILVYTSQRAPTFPLLLDTALRTPGARIVDARVVEGSPVPDCAPPEQTVLGVEPGDGLGQQIDAAGDVLVAGAGLVGADAARVFRRGPAGWALEQSLPGIGANSAPDEAVTDGQTVLIGRYYNRDTEVYRHNGTEWVLDGTLTGCPNDILWTRAVRGDLILIGKSGAVYVYRRGASGWQLDGVLRSGTGSAGFGLDGLAIGGDRVFVADEDDDLMGVNTGAIHVFRYNAGLPAEPVTCDNRGPGKWQRRALLHASDAGPDQYFPYDMRVNASGKRVLAGNQWVNAAYVFDLDGGVWTETARMTPTPVADGFGLRVALGGPDDTIAMVGSGAGAHVFAFADGTWQPADYMADGGQVAATSDTLFVGYPSEAPAGAIHVFGIEPACFLGEGN